jgi:hypothetical protein
VTGAFSHCPDAGVAQLLGLRSPVSDRAATLAALLHEFLICFLIFFKKKKKKKNEEGATAGSSRSRVEHGLNEIKIC